MDKKLIEVNREFLIQAHREGIKLIKPSTPNYSDGIQQTVSEVLKLPLNIIFLNRNSIIQDINENNAATFGYSSIKDALGKTIRQVYKKHAADFSINHDLEVVRMGRISIKEELCERKDDRYFQAITTKIPWYNDENKIIGIFGCSIPIGLSNNYSIQDALSSFIKLGLFPTKINHKEASLPEKLVRGTYLSRRERECIHYTVHGKSAKMIGRILNLSTRTVEYYLANIKEKLGVSSKSELISRVLTD